MNKNQKNLNIYTFIQKKLTLLKANRTRSKIFYSIFMSLILLLNIATLALAIVAMIEVFNSYKSNPKTTIQVSTMWPIISVAAFVWINFVLSIVISISQSIKKDAEYKKAIYKIQYETMRWIEHIDDYQEEEPNQRIIKKIEEIILEAKSKKVRISIKKEIFNVLAGESNGKF